MKMTTELPRSGTGTLHRMRTGMTFARRRSSLREIPREVGAGDFHLEGGEHCVWDVRFGSKADQVALLTPGPLLLAKQTSGVCFGPEADLGPQADIPTKRPTVNFAGMIDHHFAISGL